MPQRQRGGSLCYGNYIIDTGVILKFVGVYISETEKLSDWRAQWKLQWERQCAGDRILESNNRINNRTHDYDVLQKVTVIFTLAGLNY